MNFEIGALSMGLSLLEQDAIQLAIANADIEEKANIRKEALQELEHIKKVSKIRVLMSDEVHRNSIAIEHLVRLDCSINGGGSLYRFVKRVQYIFKYSK